MARATARLSLRGDLLAKRYRLTPQLVAANAGGPVVCLDASALGRSYPLHARRPDASMLRRLTAAPRLDVPSGRVVAPTADVAPSVVRVDVLGPIEQRAGYHDPCGGWSDGHDAIAERLIAAFQESDVLLAVDSPGGAYAGLFEGIKRAHAAKLASGRRVTGYVDETCASAAYAWAAVLCDEIYGPESMLVGSIGARSSWCGEAGALEQAGLVVEHFAWPPGKVAMASEKPLSDLGRARGERDVTLAGEAFAAAVERARGARGLTRKAILRLDADCLSGGAALDAGLVDGVASLDEVIALALAGAERNERRTVAAHTGGR